MNERVAVAIFAIVTLVSLWVAPWAVYNRETGSRAAVLLLPNRTFDFTARTEPIFATGQATVLAVSLLGLVLVAGAAALRERPRRVVWIVAGAMLVAGVAGGLDDFHGAVEARRAIAFRDALAPAIASPGPTQDGERLRVLADEAFSRPVVRSVELAREAGVVVRRLPYGGAAPGPAAFLTFVMGIAAFVFGLRIWPRASRVIDRVTTAAAVPTVSILLALTAAAVVILLLQPTPMGRDVVVVGPVMALAGRLDTLWHAYYMLFSGSLGTLKGFLDALSFATPLVFTGLAVAFGFRAGLFNIGAPGQMVLGAIGAMFVGLYMPGPAWVVVPVATLGAALGGALWGAIPGFLKARFGANEVINTILLNFVAASLLLFMLSASPTFAAPAVRVIQLVAVVVAAAIVAMLLPPLRRALGGRPRLALAVVAVGVLVGAVVVAQPRPGDAPYVLQLPFKAPGSEPKSHELSAAARLPRLPAMFGVGPRTAAGDGVGSVDAAAWAAGLLAIVAFVGLGVIRPLRARGRWPRVVATLLLAGAGYGVFAALGWRSLPVAIPPTNLNPAFLIALGAAVFVWLFMFRTRYGYELRAAGLAPRAAEYAGVSLARNTVMAMAISGALAGLTATHYVLGGAMEEYALRQSIPTGDGFDGIAVALLGANHPVGVVLAAFLFGVLKNGGSSLNIAFTDLTRDVVSMILALVVLFIAAKGFLPDRLTNPLRRAQALGDLPEPTGGGGPTDPPAPLTPPPPRADAAVRSSAAQEGR
jgi:general nucleoside transport system permease protein